MGNQISPSSIRQSAKELVVPPSTISVENKSIDVRSTSLVSENTAANKAPTNPDNKYVPRLFDVWALGINTVLGGIFYGWNEGMLAGFGSYAIGQTLMGFAYVNLAMSLAEICSTISFSGGAYGMTRVVLGFYVGFLVAAFELMEYLTYISAAALFIAGFMCDELGWDVHYTPLICLIFYILMGLLALEGNYVFWRVNSIVALGIVAIVLIYIFGSLPYTNFDRYARLDGDDDANPSSEEGDRQYWFAGGMVAFLRAMPLMTWGFGGIESIALVTDIIDNPRRNMSYGITLTVITLFVLMIGVMFVGASLPPGLTAFADMDYYMDSGFVSMGMSLSAAHWLIIPAQFAMGGGFFIPAAKLYHAISESHLVPKFMQVHKLKIQDETTVQSGHSVRETVTNQHHQWAILYVCIASYVLCLIAFYTPDFTMDSIPILLAQFTYLSDLYAYIQLKLTFHNPKEDSIFQNPFGVIGAVFSMGMFALTAVAAIGFQSEFYLEVVFVVAYTIVLSLYYFFYAKDAQIFSAEEQKKLLFLHVSTNNKRRKRSGKQLPKKSRTSFFFSSSVSIGSEKGKKLSVKQFSVHSSQASIGNASAKEDNPLSPEATLDNL